MRAFARGGEKRILHSVQNDRLVAKQTFFGTALEAVPYAGTEDCCFFTGCRGRHPLQILT